MLVSSFKECFFNLTTVYIKVVLHIRLRQKKSGSSYQTWSVKDSFLENPT